jgi:hypothetical protein
MTEAKRNRPVRLGRRYAVAAAAVLSLLVTPVFADLFSSYAVNGRGNDGKSYDGTVNVTPAEQVYRLEFCCDKFKGLGIEYQDFLAFAYVSDSNHDSGDLNIYRRAGNAWIGVFSDYTDNGLGAEVLSNNGQTPALPNLSRAKSRKPVGKYRISGTNPNGSTYTGEVEIKSWSDAFEVARKIGSDETSGTAVGFDGALVINVGKDNSRVPIGVLGLFVPEGDGFIGVWVRAGTQRMGAERWARE